MGTVLTRTLAANYTPAQLQAAALSLFTEGFGAPTYYNPNAAKLYGHDFIEFPNFGGLKFFLRTLSATSMQYGFASSGANSVVYAPVAGGTGVTYKNSTTFGTINLSGADNTVEGHLWMIKGDSYQIFGTKFGANNFGIGGVCELRNPPLFWGSRRRVYSFTGGAGAGFLPGENPWGSMNPATGSVATAGLTAAQLAGSRFTGINTLLAKRQIHLGTQIHNNEANVGFEPLDFGYLSNTGVANGSLGIADAGTDGLYFILPTSLGICVKVASAPFPGLTVYPAYVYNLSKPIGLDEAGGGGETVIEPHPSRLVLSGQIWPSPHGLQIVGQP